tara:strand:+ start:1183 stop:1917 length:735 start_codon:yes stop_codon:yes gene_type:complete
MNNDLTILPIQPPESEKKPRKNLHPNLPDIYKGQLIVCAAPIRSGKSVLWNNFLHNPNFYADCFQNVDIISNTIFNDASSRFSANKWKNTSHEMYDDKIIMDIVNRQKQMKTVDGDSSFCLILDDICGELNRHGRKGGKAIHFATRFRHSVNKGDPVMMFYANQKYNDVATIIRNNMTGLLLSGNIKSSKELQTIKDDVADTFGGSAKFDEMMSIARKKPFSWLYFRLDTTPPEVYLDFKEKLF